MATKPKTVFIVGFIALALAAAASISLFNYLKGQEKMVKGAVATENVIVASVEIPVGTAINTTHLKTAAWPAANMPQGAFTAAEQVVGRQTLDRIMPGDPVTELKLIPREGVGGILTYKIPEGHRAMTVAVDQVSGVAGFITPGSMVDIVLTTTVPGAAQPVSKIVLQNVPVLAIAQMVEQQKDGQAVVVPTVTMDVTPEDAEKLAIASSQGKLQLVLRRAGDKDLAKTTGANISKVFSGIPSAPQAPQVRKAVSPVKPAKPAEAKTEKPQPAEDLINVEILRANTRSVETFKAEK